MWTADGQQDGGLVPGTMVGEYRVEQLVGEGGMGQVYGAVHPLIGKRAAIKVLLPEICRSRQMVERFVMEARSVNQIGHPNIVDIFAFGALPDGRQYMVMEWLRGESLSDRMHRSVLPLADTCDILSGIAAALDAAHEKGIIHRDLKPHNVYLCEVKGQKPQVKLLDFGLVKLMGDEDDGRVERTRSGSVLGTPAYMSPEQALGKAVDTRSDNYSLGVMAFQMFTGRLPFNEDSAMGLMVAHMQQPPTMPSSVAPNMPPEVDQLVLGLLAKDPNHRPTMIQTMEMLAFIRGAYSPGHRSDSLPPRPMLNSQSPSAPTWAPPGQAANTTIGGQSQGEQVLTARRDPPAPSSGKWKLAVLAVVVVAGASIGIVVATKGGGGSGSGSGTTESNPIANQPVPPPVAVDAAVAQTPPPALDAAVAAVPVDAPEVVAVPVDAPAEVAITKPETPAKDPKKPRKPKKPPGNGSATTAPPPDDGDGLLQVTPKKR
jgi:serine/threonine protein kinase